MNLEINPNSRIFIIEGIAGAGKNTLHQQLKEKLSNKLVYDYPEEAMLFSWKHGWIPGIDTMRLTFYEHFLDYCDQILSENVNSVFIVDWFHISHLIFLKLTDTKSNNRFRIIIERLKKLSTFVFIPIIDDSLIEARSAHIERVEPIWQIHLQKRLKQSGCTTLTEMYGAEQKKIISLAQAQDLPYSVVNVDIKKV